MHGRESARSLYSYISIFLPPMAFPGGSDSEECLQCRRPDFTSWVGKIPWRKEWQPTSVSLPGEFQGQRSLVRLLSMGLQRGGHDWVTNTHFPLWGGVLSISAKFLSRKLAVGRQKTPASGIINHLVLKGHIPDANEHYFSPAPNYVS